MHNSTGTEAAGVATMLIAAQLNCPSKHWLLPDFRGLKHAHS